MIVKIFCRTCSIFLSDYDFFTAFYLTENFLKGDVFDLFTVNSPIAFYLLPFNLHYG